MTTKSKSTTPSEPSKLLRRGRRLAHTLQREGRPDDAQTVAALLQRLETDASLPSARAWLTTGEVARRVGVSRQTVVNWVKKGILAGRRVGGRILIEADALQRSVALERILDDLDAQRPPATPQEAAAQVEMSRQGWTWQDPTD